MNMVFPASSGEKCPRDDCGSTLVERLGTQADFQNLSVDSRVRTLWLCLACQRPFKLVRTAGVHGGVKAERDRPAPLLFEAEPVAGSARVMRRRAS